MGVGRRAGGEGDGAFDVVDGDLLVAEDGKLENERTLPHLEHHARALLEGLAPRFHVQEIPEGVGGLHVPVEPFAGEGVAHAGGERAKDGLRRHGLIADDADFDNGLSDQTLSRWSGLLGQGRPSRQQHRRQKDRHHACLPERVHAIAPLQASDRRQYVISSIV